MIYAEQKQFDEIYTMLEKHEKIFILGCGTCTTVSMSGGEEQVNSLASKLKIKKPGIEISTNTIRRQCDKEFIEQIQDEVESCDAIISLACGAGVQMVAEYFEDIPVYPGLNTCFVGTNEEEATWKQRCSLCGDCLLDKTGGICPHTICPKGLLNGPCGGMNNGKCEVYPENECVWVMIYQRLKKQDNLKNIQSIYKPRDYRKTRKPQNISSIKKDISQNGGDE
jgi:hypothetical protein